MDEHSDKIACNVHFVRDNKGLTTHFQSQDSDEKLETPRERSEHRRELTVNAGASEYHGIITVPVRLPRYLMPAWSTDDWSRFIESEIGFFYNFVDEAVVQCLSLALVTDGDRRKEALRTADEVVVDFRGDLPNKYLAMMLGGYKVGLYRSGNNWPIWLSIQPTYDLALKEAEGIRNEAKLPKKPIAATGALARFLKADLGTPILSNSSAGTGTLGWIVAGVAVAVGITA